MKEITRTHVTSADTPYRQNIQAGRHSLVCDEPESLGGRDAGASPYDFILAGLGACTAITLRMYAERKQWAIGHVTVDLQLLKNKEGETRIDRQISCDGTVDDAQWTRLLQIAEKTPVTLTLKAGATIQTRKA